MILLFAIRFIFSILNIWKLSARLSEAIVSCNYEQIKDINQIIINTKVQSLGGYSPREAFVKTYGFECLNILFK